MNLNIAQKFKIYLTTAKKDDTIAGNVVKEFENLVKPLQTNKDKKTVYLYSTNIQEQHAYIDSAKNRGYQVLLMETMLDPHYINQMESKLLEFFNKNITPMCFCKIMRYNWTYNSTIHKKIILIHFRCFFNVF